jgi:putative peptidoglycan lipid II flippase
LGLWSPDRPLLRRLSRIALATMAMSLGLLAAKSFAPPPGSLVLAALCLGGLGLYALAAWLTGAVGRDDWARLPKNS